MNILDRIHKNPINNLDKSKNNQTHIPDHSSHKTTARKLERSDHISDQQAIGKIEETLKKNIKADNKSLSDCSGDKLIKRTKVLPAKYE